MNSSTVKTTQNTLAIWVFIFIICDKIVIVVLTKCKLKITIMSLTLQKKKNEQKQVLRVQKHSLRDEAYLDAVKMPL